MSQKNNSRHSSHHHIIPTSRGGPKNRWNKKSVDFKKHQDLHILFANLLPEEIILILIQKWADERGFLKEEILGFKQLKAWYRFFDTNCVIKAADVIRRNWDLTEEEKKMYEEWKAKRKRKITKLFGRIRKILSKGG